MIALDKMTPGVAPTDFEFARTGQGGPAQWTVTSDASAAVGLAIEQTSTDTTDYRLLTTDGVDVVVEGRLGHDGTFRATTLLAKCASRYENAPEKYKDTPGYKKAEQRA